MIQAPVPDQRGWQFANPLRQPVVISVSAEGAVPSELHLSDEEIARAGRFVQSEARSRFIVQHQLLRCYLSHWLKIRPDELHFGCNAFGKPSIENCSLQFSISRSGNHLAFYFGQVAGGIDIEEQRPSLSFKPIIEEHFHPNERVVAQTDEGFFTLWTRKEALLKAIGTGLTDELSSFDCTLNRIEIAGRTFTLTTYVTAAHVISLALCEADATRALCFNL